MTTDGSQSTVGIIVLNWNEFEETCRCLEQISKFEYPNKVYLIDNGSSDGSGVRLQERFEWVNTILIKENKGFAAGCNVGIKQAIEDEIEYILLLNNDIIFEQNPLPLFVETIETHADVAAVGCPLKNTEGEISFAGGKSQPILARKKIHYETQSTQPYRTEYLTGAMMFIDLEFLTEIGLLDERYFFGREDAQLCYDAQKLGWDLYIDPRVTAIHKGGASAGSQTPFRYYHNTRNRIQFTYQLPLSHQLVFTSFFVTTRLVRFLQWSLTGKSDRITATLSGVVDHFKSAPFRKPESFD